MKNVAKSLAGIVALLFFGFGASYMLAPAGALEAAGLEAASTQGLATGRALIGGSFVTFGILIVMHVVVHDNHGVMRMVILFLLLSIIGRIISLVVDGSSAEAIRNLLPVSLMFLVSIGSLVLFLRSERAEKAG